MTISQLQYTKDMEWLVIANGEWEGGPKGESVGNIEGTLVVFPDGYLYNAKRYDITKLRPDRGLILAYKVNDNDYDAPLLSLMSSDDMINWKVVCDLYDYREKYPEYTGLQYVDFMIEGDDILYLCRTAMNRPHNFHDSNYITFLKVNGCETAFYREVFHIKQNIKNDTVNIFAHNEAHVG